MPAGGKVQVEHCTVALLNAGERLQALGGCCKTSEAEVLETYDTAIGDARNPRSRGRFL